MLKTKFQVKFSKESSKNANKDSKGKSGDGKKTVLFIVGGPGSGKGTVCTRLKDKYGLVHLSTGDLLREEAKSGSEKGKELQQKMTEGALVTSTDLVELVKAAMAKSDGPFMLDGFPRNHDNVNAWGTMMEADTNTVGMLCLRLSPETCKERLLGRNEGRADDNEETILKRLNVFETETVPVIEDMKAKGNVMEVDASKSKEEVFEECCAHLDKLMKERQSNEEKLMQETKNEEKALENNVNDVKENVPAEPHANAMYENEEKKLEEEKNEVQENAENEEKQAEENVEKAEEQVEGVVEA